MRDFNKFKNSYPLLFNVFSTFMYSRETSKNGLNPLKQLLEAAIDQRLLEENEYKSAICLEIKTILEQKPREEDLIKLLNQSQDEYCLPLEAKKQNLITTLTKLNDLLKNSKKDIKKNKLDFVKEVLSELQP